MAFDTSRPVESWWLDSVGENVQCSDLSCERNDYCDVAVIGAGFTGLSAAYHIAMDYEADVRVLDASYPGFGCSGRNGGFVGGEATKLDIDDIIKKFGLAETKRFYKVQREATETVATILEAESIDADKTGSSLICFAHKLNRVEKLQKTVEYVKKTLGENWTFMTRDECTSHGLAGPQVFAGIKIPDHFGLHPLKYVFGLARAAQKRGVTIYNEAPVRDWKKEGGYHTLVTSKGNLKAKKVIVGTNGYTSETMNMKLSGRLLPALSNILVTRPLSRAEQLAQGWTTHDTTFDTRKLLHYVRLLPDGRFLFGGRGGLDASLEGKKKMRACMEKEFKQMFPAWRDVEFTHFWNGFVCLTYDRVAHIGRVDDDDTVWCALAYHGNGVSAATAAGKTLSKLVMGSSTIEHEVPLLMQGIPPRFPFAFLRTTYLQGAYWWYQVNDNFF